ncbi:MAG TPA: methylated-DNA--[protein]-cysteine S-methyltransferase [Candidatus Binataceae bacterium]|nr:methylated-DNA--[protein]-cysteine S-methyltransferase [Candidatus Binataceae bacterium]
MNRSSHRDQNKTGAGRDDRTIDAMVRTAHARIRRAMRFIRRPEARIGVVRSAIGRLLVAQSPRGLAAVQFLGGTAAEPALDALRRKFDLVEDEGVAEEIRREIERHFAGHRDALARPVDLSLVDSEFQRRALGRLRNVPPGSVITYRGLAAAIGEPDSQRAIGNAMASNPVPIFVPCHRVIRSDGSIGNYGGGVERKIRLLRAEGFEIENGLRLPGQAVLGHRKTHIFCRPGCAAARRADSSQMLIFADPEHARRAGLRACKLCRPI